MSLNYLGRRRVGRERAVEVIGLPGSGKSTATALVAERLHLPLIRTWTGPTWRGPTSVRLFLRAPYVAAVSYLAIATRRGATRVEIRRAMSVQRRYIDLRRRDFDMPTLLDEGPVHALYVAMYGTAPTRVSNVLLRLLIRRLRMAVHALVYLDVEKAECVTRFRQSGRTSVRFNESTTDEEVDAFVRDNSYGEIRAALQRVDRLAVTTVNPGEMEEVVRSMVAQLSA